jgi:hypothetical protein
MVIALDGPLPTVRVTALDVTPEDCTVIVAVVAEIKKLEGITAVNWPELTKVVGSGVLLK